MVITIFLSDIESLGLDENSDENEVIKVYTRAGNVHVLKEKEEDLYNLWQRYGYDIDSDMVYFLDVK